MEIRRHLQADHFVGLGFEQRTRLTGRDRCGDHDPRRPQRPRRSDSGPHRRTGGDAVVDEDRRATRETQWWPTTTVGAFAAIHFGTFALGDSLELTRGMGNECEQFLVANDHASGADRAHREFGLSGHADLADHQYVQRCAQGSGHLDRHRHAAARQPEHDRRGRRRRSLAQGGSEQTPGLGAIGIDTVPHGSILARARRVDSRNYHGDDLHVSRIAAAQPCRQTGPVEGTGSRPWPTSA